VCVWTREGYTPNSQEDTHGHGAWMAFVSGTWREGKAGSIRWVDMLSGLGIAYPCWNCIPQFFNFMMCSVNMVWGEMWVAYVKGSTSAG
jgi:hypothetical protein